MKTKTTTSNRRNFLKLSTLGATGFFLAPSQNQAENLHTINQSGSKGKIIYRTLGKTGIKLPVISCGKIPVDNDNLVKAVLKSGIIHVDSAHGYHDGKNEEVLGRIMKDFDRKKFTIATKIHVHTDRDTGLFTKEATTQSFIEKFNISLKRLDMDYVDILYVHAVANGKNVTHAPTLKALETLRNQGKVRFTGISTHRNEPEVIDAMIESKAYDVILTSYNFQQDELVKVTDAINRAGEAGLGIVAMKTKAGDYFDKEKTKPVNSTAAIKWVLQNKNVHTIVLTIRSFEQLENYWAVMENTRLKRREKKDLEYDNSTGSLYCPGCGKCTQQCNKQLPIPDIMRAYMYAYGYQQTTMAKQLIESLEIENNPCADCEICKVECNKKFDVKARITDIIRIKNVPDDFLL